MALLTVASISGLLGESPRTEPLRLTDIWSQILALPLAPGEPPFLNIGWQKVHICTPSWKGKHSLESRVIVVTQSTPHIPVGHYQLVAHHLSLAHSPEAGEPPLTLLRTSDELHWIASFRSATRISRSGCMIMHKPSGATGRTWVLLPVSLTRDSKLEPRASCEQDWIHDGIGSAMFQMERYSGALWYRRRNTIVIQYLD